MIRIGLDGAFKTEMEQKQFLEESVSVKMAKLPRITLPAWSGIRYL